MWLIRLWLANLNFSRCCVCFNKVFFLGNLGYYLEDNGYNKTIFEFMQVILKQQSCTLSFQVILKLTHSYLFRMNWNRLLKNCLRWLHVLTCARTVTHSVFYLSEPLIHLNTVFSRPRSTIVDMTLKVRRKRHEFIRAVSKGNY
jgi:hypothetical protein